MSVEIVLTSHECSGCTHELGLQIRSKHHTCLWPTRSCCRATSLRNQAILMMFPCVLVRVHACVHLCVCVIKMINVSPYALRPACTTSSGWVTFPLQPGIPHRCHVCACAGACMHAMHDCLCHAPCTTCTHTSHFIYCNVNKKWFCH
jgi:hypothetical protein